MLQWRHANEGKWRVKPEPEFADKCSVQSAPSDAELRLKRIADEIESWSKGSRLADSFTVMHKVFRLAKGDRVL
jgi:hypothetical protein